MPQILTGAAATGQRHALRRRLAATRDESPTRDAVGAMTTPGKLEITIKIRPYTHIRLSLQFFGEIPPDP
jgi:hypothetical protein